MAYAAARGGKQAMEAAEKLIEYYRQKGNSAPIEVTQIRQQMRLAVDQVMGEGSLYAPDFAALSLKQSEGDSFEAAFLLRAFRSTLSRNSYSQAIDTSEMEIIRRVSAAFKDIPGGQYLGPTRDYTKRLLRLDLMEESTEHVKHFINEYLSEYVKDENEEVPAFPKVIELLRKEGLIEDDKQKEDTSEGSVDDITRQPLRFPASRAMRLQSLARGETGAMMSLAYSSVRGYGQIHPTLGEMRVGYVPFRVEHPLYSKESITVGKVLVTEAEILARKAERGEGEKAQFSIGYGLCFGHNETKAIAMGTLDLAMSAENPKTPAEDEEFVLYHIDGIEASGFVNHWKLPHYVDFQAEVQRIRSVQKREDI